MKKDKSRNSNALEKEFKKLYNKHSKEIEAKLKQIDELINEVESMSEQHSIPVRTSFSPNTYNYYIPNSFNKKFRDLDTEFLEDIAEIYLDEYSSGLGWQRSFC